jgi:DNA (cytosine-5)-methyltransferase 1
VLEAFTESEIPMPESGRWANAGMVRSRGVDLAWTVKNSQHHRTAQRRKRLFVVVDFTGRRAGEILFESSCLSRYFAAREREEQGIAAYTESGTGSACSGSSRVNKDAKTEREYLQEGIETCYCAKTENPQVSKDNVLVNASGQVNAEIPDNLAPALTLHQKQPYICSAFMAGQAKNARSIAYSETVSPTLKGSPSGLNQIPCICEPQIARTLTARGDGSPCADSGPNIIAFSQNQRNEVRDLNDIAGCLAAEPGMKQQTYIIEESNCLTPWDTQYLRIHTPDGKAPTLTGADGCTRLVMCPVIMKSVPQATHHSGSGTLVNSGAELSRPASMARETDFCIAYCIQGNMICRKEEHGPKGNGVNKEMSFTVSAADRHAVAAVDCRNLKECGDISGTIQAKSGAGYSLNYQNPIRTGYIVRRLTPTECELLMSLPSGWTEYGHDGRQISDSARYQMCGNSIVVNVLAYIMQNIAAHLQKDGDRDE